RRDAEALVSLVQDAVTDARALHALLNAGHWGVEGARMRGGHGTGQSGAKEAGAWRQTAAAVYNTGSVGTPAPLERDHKTDPSGFAGKTGEPNGRRCKESRAKAPAPVAPTSRADATAPAVASKSGQPTEATSLAAGIDWSTRKRDRKCATASSGSQSEQASGWSVRPSEHPGQMLWYNVSTGEVDWVSVS
ncbi:MAG: hypothetical protein ACPIOQ_23255, partial [Promethearchaeia archaeon]